MTASSSLSAAASKNHARILHTYRTMVRMIQQIPNETQALSFRTELRTKFRVPLDNDDKVDDRLREAGEKIAFLRIATPKGNQSDGNSSGRWVYRNGKRVEEEEASSSATGGQRVVSNFTGHNLDPCMVKRHSAGLKRAGFQNNLHAKGIF